MFNSKSNKLKENEMGSPAKVLADLFQSVMDEGNAAELFAVAAAKSLGREGNQSAIEVLARILELIEDSHRMVALLNASDTQKGLVGRYLAPLAPFRDFSVFHYQVKDAKDNFLQPPTIQNLLILDVMISGVSNPSRVSDEALSETAKLTAFMEHIHDSDLPEPVVDAFLGRAVQMLDILNHFEFFGEKNLQQKIDALLGQLTVATATAGKKSKVTLQAIAKTVVKIGAGIIFANNVANGYLALTNSVPEILGLPSPDPSSGE